MSIDKILSKSYEEFWKSSNKYLAQLFPGEKFGREEVKYIQLSAYDRDRIITRVLYYLNLEVVDGKIEISSNEINEELRGITFIRNIPDWIFEDDNVLVPILNYLQKEAPEKLYYDPSSPMIRDLIIFICTIYTKQKKLHSINDSTKIIKTETIKTILSSQQYTKNLLPHIDLEEGKMTSYYFNFIVIDTNKYYTMTLPEKYAIRDLYSGYDFMKDKVYAGYVDKILQGFIVNDKLYTKYSGSDRDMLEMKLRENIK